MDNQRAMAMVLQDGQMTAGSCHEDQKNRERILSFSAPRVNILTWTVLLRIDKNIDKNQTELIVGIDRNHTELRSYWMQTEQKQREARTRDDICRSDRDLRILIL